MLKGRLIRQPMANLLHFLIIATSKMEPKFLAVMDRSELPLVFFAFFLGGFGSFGGSIKNVKGLSLWIPSEETVWWVRASFTWWREDCNGLM